MFSIWRLLLNMFFLNTTFFPFSALLPLSTFLSILVPTSIAIPTPQALSPPPPSQGDYPDPEPCRGNCTWVHDPSIIFENDRYWRFSTSGNIAISTAYSLEGPWDYQGALLPNGTKIKIRADQDIWAPSVSKFGDTFYCHYSVSYIGSQNSEIGVATSKTLEPGSWTDHGAIGLHQNARYNLIDPYVYQESPSEPIYFTFGSYWTGIQQFELKNENDLISLGGDYVRINNIISNTTDHYAVQEGATTFKHEQFYYMFFSVGQCCRGLAELMAPGDEYHVVVCRAEFVTGPYYDKSEKDCLKDNGGTTILGSHGDIYAPGGQGVMVDPQSQETVMYYHYVRPSVGYVADQFFFGFNHLEWKDGWPVLV